VRLPLPVPARRFPPAVVRAGAGGRQAGAGAALPPRALTLLLRAILVLSFLACPGIPSLAQTSNQLSRPWGDAVYALAEKVAAALTPARTFSINVKDITQDSPIDPGLIQQLFEADLAARGGRSVAPAPAESDVQLTISQGVEGYILIAAVRRADAQSVSVVSISTLEKPPGRPSPSPGLERKILWTQAAPFVDFAQASTGAGRALWYLLEPDRLAVYEF